MPIFRVTCRVTREEIYEVEALNEDDATEKMGYQSPITDTQLEHEVTDVIEVDEYGEPVVDDEEEVVNAQV